MNRARAAFFNALLKAARPWSLLAGLLLYAVGGGIASYLGEPIDWPVYWMGQAALLLLLLSGSFLSEYFERAGQPPFETGPRRPPPENDDGPLPPPPRGIFIQVAATTLTAGAVLTVLLLSEGSLGFGGILFIGIALLLVILYAVPPFRLVDRGYGELIMTVLLANLFPALAFLLQTGLLHRLLAMLTFPLTFLYLASALARSFPDYAQDLKNDRRTMLIRLGWQRGVSLHNVLIASAYLLLAASVLFGLPWRLAYPAFLALPVGLFQVWQINGIAGGAPPRWRMLVITSLATVGLTIYFMILALWTV